MKAYAIELKRTSYVTLIVEADTHEEAEDEAWDKLEREAPDHGDADWEVTTIDLID